MSIYEEVECDHNGHYVPHIEYDSNDRKQIAYGTTSGYPYRGSNITDGLRNWIEEIGDQDDDGGHIIPRCLSGSGRDKRNLFPQNREVNRILGRIENKEKEEIMERNLTVKFKYTFKYDDVFFPERPSAFIQEVRWFQSERLVRHFKRSVSNPLYSECNDNSENNSDYIRYNFDKYFDKKPAQSSVNSRQEREIVGQFSSSSQETEQESFSWGRVAAGVAIGGAIFAGLMGAFGSGDSTASKKNETKK